MTSIGQVGLVAIREFRGHFRSRWLLALASTALVLTPLTVYVGMLEYEQRRQDYAELLQRRDADREEGRRTLTGFQVDPALRALRPPTAASVFVRGLDAAAPAYWDVTPAGSMAAPGARGWASVYDAASTFDAGFIMRVVLGLLAAGLGATSLARDSQSGLLKTLLALRLSPRLVISGKMIGGAVTLSILSAAVASAALGTLVVAGRPLVSASLVGTLVLLVAAGTLYLWTLFAAGLIAAQLAGTESNALVVAVLIWLVAAVILPTAAPFVGKAVVPVPSRTVVEARRDRTYQQMTIATEERLGERFRALVGRDADVRAVSFDGTLRTTLEGLMTTELAKQRQAAVELERGPADAGRRQHRLIAALALLSPGALLLEATADLSGTGDAAMGRWQAAVDAYQHAVNAELFDRPPRMRLTVPERQGSSLANYRLRVLPTVSELPQFEPPRQALVGRLQTAGLPLALALGWLVIVTVAAIVFFRYQPPGTARARRSYLSSSSSPAAMP
jgi:ABC-2 family transporter protein